MSQPSFNIVHVCGLSGPQALNIASNIRLKVYKVHAINKIKTVSFETAIKPRSTNLVLLERELFETTLDEARFCLSFIVYASDDFKCLDEGEPMQRVFLLPIGHTKLASRGARRL